MQIAGPVLAKSGAWKGYPQHQACCWAGTGPKRLLFKGNFEGVGCRAHWVAVARVRVLRRKAQVVRAVSPACE